MAASRNSTDWVIIASSKGVDDLWELLIEFARLTEMDGPTIHARPQGEPRWCVHPDSRVGVEFADDDLRTALTTAATWKAGELPADLVWERR